MLFLILLADVIQQKKILHGIILFICALLFISLFADLYFLFIVSYLLADGRLTVFGGICSVQLPLCQGYSHFFQILIDFLNPVFSSLVVQSGINSLLQNFAYLQVIDCQRDSMVF